MLVMSRDDNDVIIHLRPGICRRTVTLARDTAQPRIAALLNSRSTAFYADGSICGEGQWPKARMCYGMAAVRL